MTQSNPKPKRPKIKDRVTPFYDSWITDLERCLAGRGEKTSLAVFLAHGDESKIHRWQVSIRKALSRKSILDGEFVLATNAWLQKQKKDSKHKLMDGTKIS